MSKIVVPGVLILLLSVVAASADCIVRKGQAVGGFWEVANQCPYVVSVWFCNPGRHMGRVNILAGHSKAIGAKYGEQLNLASCRIGSNGLPACQAPSSGDLRP
jgi:hypothetical protein